MKQAIKKVLNKLGVLSLVYRFRENQNKHESKEMIRMRTEFYKEFISENDLVFDVGANVGNRTNIFIALGAKVIAIEPQESLARYLAKKVKNRAIVLNKGLGDRIGVEFIYISNRSTLSSYSKNFIENAQDGRFKDYRWDNKALTQITTLNSIIAEYGQPKFCKIDVEGFELAVLSGLDVPIKSLSLEYNVPEFSNNLMDCISKLFALSPFYKFNYSIGESCVLVLDKWIPYEEFVKLISSTDFLKSEFGDIYAKID